MYRPCSCCDCRALADEVEAALKRYATYNHPEFGTIYAFEVDGFGNRLLMDTDAGTGFMHESFHKDNAANFTHPWFAWQNTLFGELILKLVNEGKTDLLNSIE